MVGDRREVRTGKGVPKRRRRRRPRCGGGLRTGEEEEEIRRRLRRRQRRRPGRKVRIEYSRRGEDTMEEDEDHLTRRLFKKGGKEKYG